MYGHSIAGGGAAILRVIGMTRSKDSVVVLKTVKLSALSNFTARNLAAVAADRQAN
jgi:hypothetical protein